MNLNDTPPEIQDLLDRIAALELRYVRTCGHTKRADIQRRIDLLADEVREAWKIRDARCAANAANQLELF